MVFLGLVTQKMSKVPSDGINTKKLKLQKDKMDPIIIRYGESLTLPIQTGDLTAQSATLYVGKPGQMYVISKTVSLVDGDGVFVLDGAETEIPLDTYYYQINVTDADGYVEKYPTPQPDCDDCESEFPQFVVCEALDATEVS